MTDSGNYAGRAAAIRETAKWIAAVFTGAGAVLFSGLSFANVTQASSTTNWLLPVGLAALPVFAAMVAVREVAGVITKDAPDTASLLPSLSNAGGTPAAQVRQEIERLLPATVATYGSLDGFERRLSTAHERVSTAWDRYEAQRTVDRRADLEEAYRALDALQDGVRDVVLCADYVGVKEQYRSARPRLLVAAIVAVVAAALSGVLAAKAEKGSTADAATGTPAPIVFAKPTRVRIFLAARDASSHTSAPCPVSNGDVALAIGGSYRRPLLLFDGADPKKAARASCRSPWTWATQSDEVVVVPIEPTDARAGS
jgi:hypothetical protein